jgi:hypothetical protein
VKAPPHISGFLVSKQEKLEAFSVLLYSSGLLSVAKMSITCPKKQVRTWDCGAKLTSMVPESRWFREKGLLGSNGKRAREWGF